MRRHKCPWDISPKMSIEIPLSSTNIEAIALPQLLKVPSSEMPWRDRVRDECDIPTGIHKAAGEMMTSYLERRVPMVGRSHNHCFPLHVWTDAGGITLKNSYFNSPLGTV
jgi:hypothetical protein